MTFLEQLGLLGGSVPASISDTELRGTGWTSLLLWLRSCRLGLEWDCNVFLYCKVLWKKNETNLEIML